MANLARGRMRNKIPELEKALTGRVQPHHRFVLAQQLDHIDYIDEKIESFNVEIEQQLERMNWPDGPIEPDASQGADKGSQGADEPEPALTWSTAVALLDTIPGVDQRTAEVILAEMGLDMNRFPTDAHLASWAGLAPGNHQSGGKRYSGRKPRGTRRYPAS